MTWAEARTHVGTDSHFDLDNVFRRVAAQCEDAAAVLLPDPGLIQRRVERMPEKRAPIARQVFRSVGLRVLNLGGVERRTIWRFADPAWQPVG